MRIGLLLGFAAVALLPIGCFKGATDTISPIASELPRPTDVQRTGSPAAATGEASSRWYTGVLVWAMSCPAIKPNGESPWPNGTTKIHELVLPTGYTVQGSNPFHVLRPDGVVVATEGEQIQVSGSIPTTVSSFCSIGPKVEVTELKAAPPR